MLLRFLNGLMRRAPPPDSGALVSKAEASAAKGNVAHAIACCERALALDPINVAAHRLLARLTLPGDYYRDVLKRIHQHLKPRTYLEIGVSKGDTIALTCPDTLAVGIDPEPKLNGPLPPNVRVIEATSDAFFAGGNVAANFNGLPVELALIDGMHHFEFALRDFINVERCCTRASTVLIHDCYPLDEISARRERVSQFWSGDIWKLVLCLKKCRPDLQINTIGCAPTGLAVTRNLDPASTVLSSRLDEICAEFIDLPYSTVARDKATLLNLYPNDWERVRSLLAA